MTASTKVLCVDDNVDAADTTADLLRLNGLDVKACHDGPSALKAARDFQPDVCILDLSMPGMDGFALAAELRKFIPGVRLIALTALWDVSTSHKTNNARFEAHLVKPVQSAILLDAIKARAMAEHAASAD